VPTNQQRREAERLRLQRQLEQRRAREAARKRFTLIASIIGTVVVIVAVVIVIVVTTGGSGKKHPEGDTVSAPKTTPAPTPSASTSAAAAAPVPIPKVACTKAPKGTTATFKGLTVTGIKNLKVAPKVSGKSATDATTLGCEDLVVGKGAIATTASTVDAQYVGVVYKTGKVFQSSWGTSPVPSFSLKTGPQGVIPGFSQGIAGAGKVTPMRVGGRRILILPAALAYGDTSPQGSGIPANASLVFVVDLQKVTG
jgi:peptidylprolyl isomerase